MSHICRSCGNKIKFEYEEKTAYCTGCNKKVTYKDTIASWTLRARVAQLKAMHELISNANDEHIYMSWICVMPDGATEEDFRDIAFDDELYNECFDLFVELIKHKGNRW